MAGNSQRKGAKRKPGSKKGAVVGSGGQKPKSLQSKGPTPKASERTGHPAKRRADAAKRREAERSRSGRSTGARHSSGGTGRGAPDRGAEGGADRGTTRAASGTRRRRPADSEYVVGRNAVPECLRAGVPSTALYVAERIDTDDRVREAIRLATDDRIPVLEAPRAELDRLSGRAPHQGLVLQVPAYEYAHPDDLTALTDATGAPTLLVALDGITDPRNLGAVVRSAAAFGVSGVVVPERRAAGVTASAWKSSAGAAARVPIARATNLSRALAAYRDAGFMVVGLAADGDADVSDLAVADGPLVVVVGSEGKGMSRLVREHCDIIAAIPIADDLESLNASVATSIALYAVARQRGL
jgi:23S rRNA (guanosine2251-2'-O)-methyltransferase